MIESLKGQLADWKYARDNTIRFLEQLSDEDLSKKLPRRTFTTIYEQIIAFCHALGINIPKDVTESMHLTGS
jgi:hypothetical protein